MSDLAIMLADILTDRPQSRQTLVTKLRTNDREVREAVAELRKAGYPVCSSSSGKGYWYGNEHDKNATVKEYRARALEMWETADAMEQGPDAQEEIIDELFANA